MSFRNRMHMYLPTGPGAGNGQPEGGDGAAGGAGAPPQGGNGAPQNDGGGSNGTGGGNDTPPGNGAPQNGNQGGNNGQQGGGSSGDVPLDQLPEGWQKHIRELRSENQDRRTKQPDYDKYKAFYDGIQGVVSPENAKTPEQLQKDIEAERSRTRDSELKLAIYQSAGEHGADANALLDSESFLRDARKLDDMSGVGDLIKTAVEKNGRLKAAAPQQRQGNGQQRPGNSGSTEFPGGAGGNQLTREDLKGMSPEAIEKARQDGRLKTLMGG